VVGSHFFFPAAGRMLLLKPAKAGAVGITPSV